MNSITIYLKRWFTNSFNNIVNIISLIEDEHLNDEIKTEILTHLNEAKYHLIKSILLINNEHNDEILDIKKWK